MTMGDVRCGWFAATCGLAVTLFWGDAVAAPRGGAAHAAPRQSTRRLNLTQWLNLVHRHNPLIGAAQAGVGVADADVTAAKWAWVPRLRVKADFAPMPNYHCVVPSEFLPDSWSQAQKDQWMAQKVDGVTNRDRYCVTTDKDTNVDQYSIQGLYFRIQVDLGIPLSAIWQMKYFMAAARARRNVSLHKVDKVRAQLDELTRKAYFSVKLARELLFTIDEGKPFLDKAIKKVVHDLDSDDDSDVSLEDKFRLQLLQSQIRSWVLDARQVEQSALDGLRALAGRGGRSCDVDADPLIGSRGRLQTLEWYQRASVRRRPEMRIVRDMLSGSRVLVRLRKMAFLPDLILATRYRYTHSNSDDPLSAYASDGLHGNSVFVGLQLRFDLDILTKVTQYRKAKAMRRATSHAKSALERQVRFETANAYREAVTARRKEREAERGLKIAKAWLTAVVQKHDMGVARAKDVADALRAFFKARMNLVRVSYESQMAVSHLATAVGLPMKDVAGRERASGDGR
ncbi:MAG: TolC family protein [Deltaproteobacteria bacterium]|nr:TolC family protein [Deltaproteobacteria bacterium]